MSEGEEARLSRIECRKALREAGLKRASVWHKSINETRTHHVLAPCGCQARRPDQPTRAHGHLGRLGPQSLNYPTFRASTRPAVGHENGAARKVLDDLGPDVEDDRAGAAGPAPAADDDDDDIVVRQKKRSRAD